MRTFTESVAMKYKNYIITISSTMDLKTFAVLYSPKGDCLVEINFRIENSPERVISMLKSKVDELIKAA